MKVRFSILLRSVTLLWLLLLTGVVVIKSNDQGRGIEPGSNNESFIQKKCEAREDKVAICPVTFPDLIAHTNAFNGKLVKITGYAALDQGLLVIYSDESAYRARQEGLSLQIRDKEVSQKQLFSLYGYKLLSITGTFSGYDQSATKSGRLGTISRIVRTYAVDPRGHDEQEYEMLFNIDDIQTDK